MSEQAGEKTEQPTPKRLEEATKRGQFARSAEIQTVFVFLGGLLALKFAGSGIFSRLAESEIYILGHLHEIPLSFPMLQGYAAKGALVFCMCAGPIILATMIGGLVAGAIQNRFQTASEALTFNWERLNPVEGFNRLFSLRAFVPTLLSSVKLGFIVLLSYTEVKQILSDPIFYTTVDLARIAEFLANSALGILLRITAILGVVAAADYAYQLWRTNKDLMMTKEEVKEELKNTEGDPHVKARQRRRRTIKTQSQMLKEVPTADVVVTNPTHFAIALKYDRKTMKAPKIVAKGSRLNALRIREIATQYHVPIIENRPLARLMFKYGKVGGEIPAQLYSAVAEVLAWVYRVNRYKYYTQGNQI